MQSGEGSGLPPLHTWKSALRRKAVLDFFSEERTRTFPKEEASVNVDLWGQKSGYLLRLADLPIPCF